MIVNVCPAATSKAPPDRFWEILAATNLLGEWTDAEFVSAEPPGAAQPGQVVHLVAPGFGRKWPVRIDVEYISPGQADYAAFVPGAERVGDRGVRVSGVDAADAFRSFLCGVRMSGLVAH